MGEKTINIEKAILIMRNELECVKEVDKCDRHCENKLFIGNRGGRYY